MNKNSLYAFYGSLRKGMSNYELYKEAMVYLYSVHLKGFKLYSMGEYPCIVKSDTDKTIVAEVVKITNPVIEKEIHDMEIEEGYFYDEVTIQNDQVGIYLYKAIENFIEVKEGDWVTFFRQNKQ